MSVQQFLRITAATGALSLLALTTACGDNVSEEPAEVPAAETQTAAPNAPEEQSASDESSDYAFGTDQDQMAQAIETAFSSDNGSARWEGNTLILRVDGDIDHHTDAFTKCMVLKELLHDDDLSVIEFPNGRAECVDILPE